MRLWPRRRQRLPNRQATVFEAHPDAPPDSWTRHPSGLVHTKPPVRGIPATGQYFPPDDIEEQLKK